MSRKSPLPALSDVVVRVVPVSEVLTPSKKPTQDELWDAFGRVKNPRDWKARVNAVIPTPAAGERALIDAAVVHFTATVPEFLPGPRPGTTRVVADGYRAGPAGDR